MSFFTIRKSDYESEVTCLIGSAGSLEFGSFMDSLREKMGLQKGEKVIVKLS